MENFREIKGKCVANSGLGFPNLADSEGKDFGWVVALGIS